MTAAELLARVAACLEKHADFWLKVEGEGWLPCRGVVRAGAGTVLVALPGGGEVVFALGRVTDCCVLPVSELMEMRAG